MMLQNLALMVQALGLGGFPHWAAHPFGWFQALEFAANDRAAGGLFPLLVIPGALGIIAALTRYAARSRASTEHA